MNGSPMSLAQMHESSCLLDLTSPAAPLAWLSRDCSLL
jgi:hypothetical protein